MDERVHALDHPLSGIRISNDNLAFYILQEGLLRAEIPQLLIGVTVSDTTPLSSVDFISNCFCYRPTSFHAR